MKRTGRQLWRTGGIASSVRKRKRASTKLPGTVERVIKAHPYSGATEKTQIAVEGADESVSGVARSQPAHEDGRPVRLKEGTEVAVKIESEKAVKGGNLTSQRRTAFRSFPDVAEFDRGAADENAIFPLIGLWASPSST